MADGEEDELQTHWVIQAPASALSKACLEAGLSENAVRTDLAPMTADDDPDGELIYPSFFCPGSAPWLAVLAALYHGGSPLHVFMRQSQASDPDTEITHVQIYPKIEQAMLELFHSFAPLQADRAADLGARVERAFDLLRNEQRPLSRK